MIRTYLFTVDQLTLVQDSIAALDNCPMGALIPLLWEEGLLIQYVYATVIDCDRSTHVWISLY